MYNSWLLRGQEKFATKYIWIWFNYDSKLKYGKSFIGETCIMYYVEKLFINQDIQKETTTSASVW